VSARTVVYVTVAIMLAALSVIVGGGVAITGWLLHWPDTWTNPVIVAVMCVAVRQVFIRASADLAAIDAEEGRTR
jgi:hypothetical protein